MADTDKRNGPLEEWDPDQDEIEDLIDEDDDLPSVPLPAALVEAMGLTAEEWEALPIGKLDWPRSLGEPPEGMDVNIIDDLPSVPPKGAK